MLEFCFDGPLAEVDTIDDIGMAAVGTANSIIDANAKDGNRAGDLRSLRCPLASGCLVVGAVHSTPENWSAFSAEGDCRISVAGRLKVRDLDLRKSG